MNEGQQEFTPNPKNGRPGITSPLGRATDASYQELLAVWEPLLDHYWCNLCLSKPFPTVRLPLGDSATIATPWDLQLDTFNMALYFLESGT